MNRAIPRVIMLGTALVCLIGFIFMPNFSIADTLSQGTEILLTFTGDCTLGGEDRLAAKDYSFQGYIGREGYGYPFEKVQQVFIQDDVTVINLEGVLYDYINNKVQKTYNFRGPTDYANIIKGASIELSFLGNNHTFDYGRQGYRSTVEALEEAGLDWFAVTDEGIKTWIYEKNGVKIGFTGANITYFNRFPDKLEKSISDLKQEGCAFIVGVMHGGQEYGPRQNKGIIRYAKFLVDQGAGLVVGHHPHVLHGIEVYQGANIIYSLGNFAFGGNAELRSYQTMLVQAKLCFDEEGRYLSQQLNLLPAHVSGNLEYNNYQPVLVEGDEAQVIIDLVASMSDVPLLPYAEGRGALQAPLERMEYKGDKNVQDSIKDPTE